MAVIRCPACGKPNPDIVDICQYCDEPLKEGVARPAPAPEAAPEPGAEIPDWMQGGAEPDAESAPAAPQPKEEPEWMWTGAGEAGGEAPTTAAVPDWMQAADAAVPAAPESAAAEIPDWMKGAEPSAGSAVEAAAPPAAGVPDWLKGAEPFAPAEPAPIDSAPAADVPDWLKGAADTGEPFVSSEPTPVFSQSPEETPAWLSSTDTSFTSSPESAAPPAEETPPWMTSGTAPSFAPPASETPAWMGGVEEASPVSGGAPATPEEVPDWMTSMRAAAAPAEEAASSFDAPAPPAEPAPAPFAAPAGDVPDWMQDLGGAPAAAAAPLPFAAPSEDMPDWMQSLGATPAAPAESAPAPFAVSADSGAPDWMSSLGAPTPSAPEPPTAPPAGDSPDWLSNLAAPPAAAPAVDPFAQPVGDSSAPDWMKDLGESVSAGETPDWLAGLGDAPAQTSSKPGTDPFAVPSAAAGTPDWLAPAAGAAAASLFGSADASAPSTPAPSAPATGMPDWLAAMRPKGSGAAAAHAAPAPSGAPGGVVAPTALPSWLEAMRPVNVVAPIISPERDNYEETVGVLAGMRGVLRAEPSASLPTTKTATRVHQLEVGAGQAQMATALTALLQEDTEAAPASSRRFRLSLPLDRLVVMIALALVVVAVPVVAPGLFPLPTTIAPEAEAAFELIDNVPLDRPVLVAFDYDPAQLGELNPPAQALLDHLMRHGAPIVAVSTRAAGAPVADELLTERAAAHGYTYGTNFVNLGYIPGGPVGLLQFAANPRSLFPGDFRGTPDLWSLPITHHLGNLHDYGLLVLISATPDDTRAWVEQTRRYAAGLPTVAAVSAGAAPLVRPYYESEPRQINAMIVGILGAAQYEQRAGVPGAASQRWDAMNAGLITAAALILAGNLTHAALHLLRRVRFARRR